MFQIGGKQVYCENVLTNSSKHGHFLLANQKVTWHVYIYSFTTWEVVLF